MGYQNSTLTWYYVVSGCIVVLYCSLLYLYQAQYSWAQISVDGGLDTSPYMHVDDLFHTTNPPSSTILHLFQWTYPMIADECRLFLTNTSIRAIVVGPVTEAPNIATWHTVYQPLSYRIGNHLGSEQQFRDMIRTCNAVQIDIVVDMIINHVARPTKKIGTLGSHHTSLDHTPQDRKSTRLNSSH